ncbi:SPFH domain-containing protein [Georgenia sp. Z1491]|uniref:SPFH domain-containing protein n=1 Tax=Georgenia sp. Z1491 TaxID=3416707 RepID=UPI003CEC0DBA
MSQDTGWVGRARGLAQKAQQGLETIDDLRGGSVGDGSDAFRVDVAAFSTAKSTGGVGTRIVAQRSSLSDAGQKLNRSEYENGSDGPVHVITPMVMPSGGRVRALIPVVILAIVGAVGYWILSATNVVDVTRIAGDGGLTGGLATALFGVHYWVLLLVLAGFLWWRAGMVMVPDGCQALISRFGKVERVVGPGLVTLLNPWRRVSYIVNTTREYPFNAPIHEAPTRSGVQASVDLFLQFRIDDPREFIFVLGAVQGFQDKLNNAISETTRSLIYEQEAADIYDLVGESTQVLLDQLNEQFRPAVELTHANITHAEPSSDEYRADLGAPEMIRVAKEAYTYEYELQLKKEQNEGDLNKDLASLRETLSSIQADIAKYQAQMDTALERETNRADAMARQRFVESESTAHANAALLEAQALDIRALSAANAPEILSFRYQQDLLDRLEQVAESLPQIVQVGEQGGGVDFLRIASELVGGTDLELFSESELSQIRERAAAIETRVAERQDRIAELLEPPEETEVAIVAPSDEDELPGADRLEEIRRSVAQEIDDDAGTTPGAHAAPSAPAEPAAPADPAAPAARGAHTAPAEPAPTAPGEPTTEPTAPAEPADAPADPPPDMTHLPPHPTTEENRDV